MIGGSLQAQCTYKNKQIYTMIYNESMKLYNEEIDYLSNCAKGGGLYC